jgi:two-component system, chemotaxis family, CheB/CheR fusion protein
MPEEPPPAKPIDPAATDESSENARNGAEKRRDSSEPAAVVGLGASAGGISVLQQFFGDMSPKSGLAFVVVMHLSPEHESNLANVIKQKTSMPVTQVTEPVKVKPNHVYVIPPNHQLTFEDSTLHLLPPQQALGRRVTIDLFFRTLAQAYGHRAVGVILSGSDSDGVIGLKHVRAQGGVTIAQDPAEAEHNSMPATAISTGMVDWVLPVADMPPKLMEFVRNETRMKLPPEDPHSKDPEAKDPDAPGGETVSDITRAGEDESALRDVLTYLRAQTGHDFSHYKRATVLRRVARRMQVNSLETILQYRDFLRHHPAEARALLQDLLIGVTHFFRDHDAFAALEANIPQLFAGRREQEQIRIWVAGCASGEEAYSIAMLLFEHAERLDRPPSIQVFASDLDEHAIQDARDGLYPTTIEEDVSLERLRRFFDRDHGRYRVKKNLREKILFASHNLLKDPPFSRVDLISCRNLLIYLNRAAQEQVFDVLHFSLRPGGMLFIGGSETGGNVQGLFSPVDAKHRLFVRRSVPRPSWRIPALPLRNDLPATRGTSGARLRTLSPLTPSDIEEASIATEESHHAGQERRAALFGELHLKLLEEYGPPSAVVNEAHDIVHLSEKAGRYLQFVAGEPTVNLINVVNPALRIELRTALFRAGQSRETVQTAPQTAEVEGRQEAVVLEVRPMRSTDAENGFFLVLFHKQSGAPAAPPQPAGHEVVTRGLDEEVQFLKEQLNSTVEQYEASNEELKASNEELQAVNEEMRSATEELETSKEELQSVNEELTTVNHELKSSVEELSRANTDLNNLMVSTDIGTIFLDRQLRIQRFTPSAQKIFNLLPADLGRPLSDITTKLAYGEFIHEAENVLDNLATTEREVRVGEESWYVVRIAPYRTQEDRIAGVVATFIDITRRKRAEEELRESEARLRRALEIETVGVMYFNVDGRITSANNAFLRMSGYTREDLNNGLLRWERMPAPEFMERSRAALEEFKRTGKTATSEKQYIRKDGTRWWGLFSASTLSEGVGVKYVVDITDRKHAEKALRESEERFRQFAENSADVFWIVDAKTQQLEYINPVFEKMFGVPRDAVMRDGKHRLDLVHPADREQASKNIPRVLAGENFVTEHRIIRPSDGAMRWIRTTAFPIRDSSGRVWRGAGVTQDVTEDKERAEAIRAAEERFRLLVEGARDYAMFLMDPENRVTFWSRGAERLFGWSQEEVIGKSASFIFTPEDQRRGAVEEEIAVATKEGRALDKRWHMQKDGSRFWTDGVLMRLDDDGGVRGFAKIARDATDQRRAEDELRHAHDQLEQRVVERTADLILSNKELQETMAQRRQLEKELLEVSERERRRIGEDLHDMICQELTATALFLKSSAKKAVKESPVASAALEDAAQTVNRNVVMARELARGLQAVELSAAGLVAALRDLAGRASESAAVKCHFKAARGVRVSDDTVALHLYRIAQEAVNNAVKHSGAKNVLVTLNRSSTHICVTVEDDGKGIVVKRRGKGLGLHMMRYRANALGGELKITRRQSGGTQITCIMPSKARGGGHGHLKSVAAGNLARANKMPRA